MTAIVTGLIVAPALGFASAIVVAERHMKRAIASASFKRDPFTGRIRASAYWDASRCAVS